MSRAVVCSLLVASALAGGGVVFSRSGDHDPGAAPPAVEVRPGATSAPSHEAVASAAQVRGRLPQAPAMPRDYDVLLRRSIFGRGTARGAAAERPAGPPPEARWVLRGVLHQEGRFTAFVEDLSARTLRRLRAGDEVAGGRLERVSFDGLAYEADGVLTQVHIGQDLSGNAAPPPTTSPAASRPRGKVEASEDDNRGDKEDRKDKGEKEERRKEKADKAAEKLAEKAAEKAARKERQDDADTGPPGKRDRDE